jgi:hypothetical protein
MGMFSKMPKKAVGGIGGGLFRGKKAAMAASLAAVPPVAMDPTATPSDVPVATQPSDSPFAAAATAAMAKMPAKKAMATPAATPGKKRFGQMVRSKAY